MNKELGIGLLAIAVVVALIAMLSPWWTVSLEMEGASDSTSAGPFDANNDIITSGSATLTGILMLLGLIAFAGALAVALMGFFGAGNDMTERMMPLVAFVGGFFVILAVVLAIFMYPGEVDMGFWDSESSSNPMFGDVEMSTFAAWGWYMAIAGALIGIGGGVVALRSAGEGSPKVMTEQTSGPVE